MLLCALLVGRVCGGSLDRLGALDLRRRRLVVAALGVQALGAVVGGPAYALGLAGSRGARHRVPGRQPRRARHRAGGAGLGANALVVALNGAMPVSPDAAARAGVPLDDVARGRRQPPRASADDGTRLPLLGDVVPVLLPLRPEVVSPGDVLVASGLAQLVVVGMLAGRPTRTRCRRPLSPPAEPCATLEVTSRRESAMAKRGRKRRARKKNAANHGKRPNA